MAYGFKSGGRQRRDLHRFCGTCLQKFSRRTTTQLLGTSSSGPSEDRVHSDIAFCSKGCASKHWHATQPEEVLAARLGEAVASMKARGRYDAAAERMKSLGAANPINRPEVRAAALASTLAWTAAHPEEHRANMVAASALAPRGKDHHFYGKAPEPHWARYRCTSDRIPNLTFRSSWERDFAEALLDRNVHFEYEPETIETPYGSYTPDFRVGSRFIELKGVVNNKQELKIAWCIGTGMNLTVLRGSGPMKNRRPNLEALADDCAALSPA